MVKKWAFSGFADINKSAKGQLKIQNISPIQVLNCCGRHQARNVILSKNYICGSYEHYVLAMTSFIFQLLWNLIFSWCPKCKYSYNRLLFTFVAFSKISLHAASTSAVVFSCVIERVTSSKTDRYKSNQNNVLKVNMHSQIFNRS